MVDGAEAPAEPTSPVRARRLGAVGLVAAAVVAADQGTKQWALERLSGGRIVEVVGSLRFALTFNTGMAFSRGDGANLGPFIAVLALGVVGWLLWSGHSATALGALASGLVAGGALGNLADRALRSGPYGAEAGFMGGAVVDFIDLQWWPVFNVADSGVVVGALLLVVTSFREPHPVAAR
ncbi:MAG TPA: signal peptidase II [Acidimicrobiales bacterium]|nr:signal peptidase II [Acidimicrobiales bacterium]